ncbi:predicted protein [Nematostella vectensis]|uniref:Uncharacterized protein n=1 Tax=Nematostella vectensis TaxID=45351 RepID=A7RNI0_NEMVE|nr:predicted protein [Nematostella vectensis]|eukprot:XP_001638989.1 predicted protein [Nematostella vectensis]
MAVYNSDHTTASSKEIAVVSGIQMAALALAGVFANYLLADVTFVTKPVLAFKIFTFVYAPLCFTLLLSRTKSKWTLMQLVKLPIIITLFAAFFHIIAVLYGAPFLEKTEETFVWGLVMAILLVTPLCAVFGTELEVFVRMCSSSWYEYSLESYFQQCIIMTVFGAWIGAFTIPLDWDRPWQGKLNLNQ